MSLVPLGKRPSSSAKSRAGSAICLSRALSSARLLAIRCQLARISLPTRGSLPRTAGGSAGKPFLTWGRTSSIRVSAPLARLLGGFSACDTSSLTTTREDGSHIDWVMQRALHSADCEAEQVELVKLHGTATGANDHAESNGMRRLFGDSLPHLSVLKPWLGHTLGACGLSETLLLLAALRQGPLPALDYAAEALLPLPTEPTAIAPDALLLANFFGFGGNNASLVLQGVAR